MGTLFATDRDGTEHQITGRPRASFMELLKMNGLSVEALCSGCCQCATCHIYIDKQWLDKLPEPAEFEKYTLEGEAEPDQVKPNSRLSCQIDWQEEYDGIKIQVAPEL